MPLNKATKSTNAGVSVIILYLYCILQNSRAITFTFRQIPLRNVWTFLFPQASG